MLIAEEEHKRNRVIEFVHLLEVGHLIQIADVEDGEVFNAVGYPVEYFVLAHTVCVPVTAKADDY